MPNLLIRNVDGSLHARLKERAAAHCRTLEEEAREVLCAALARLAAPQENIVGIAQRLFGPKHGVELNIPPRGRADAQSSSIQGSEQRRFDPEATSRAD